MNDNELHYLSKKYESKDSIRDIEILSESYDIAPYSIRVDPSLNLGRIFFGAFFCLIGIISLTVGVRKQINSPNFEGDEYWVATFCFLFVGIGIIYHTLQSKYRLLENYS